MSVDSATAHEFFKNSQDYGLSFTYRGPFSDDITNRILDISENTIAINQQLPKINRKVSFLLVECFQNIVRHGEHATKESLQKKDDGVFSLKNLGTAYLINSVNLVKEDQVEDLKQTVESINNKDKDQLKALYKERLEQNSLSEKGGAGLGLIELARKSGQKILYEIEPCGGDLYYFHQQILLLNAADDQPDNYNHINTLREKYRMMERSDVILEYKGDFSQKSVLPIINIIESTFASDAGSVRVLKRLIHILVEVLQNVSKHALEQDGSREGIFMIGKNEKGVFLQAGNKLDNSKQKELKEKLLQLREMNQEELKQAHMKRIKESLNLTDKTNSGLGLMEIAKASSEKIRFQFEEIDKNQSFFSMHITVQ
ncbi:SiaB family protein kinase [Halocola ammonii]